VLGQNVTTPGDEPVKATLPRIRRDDVIGRAEPGVGGAETFLRAGRTLRELRLPRSDHAQNLEEKVIADGAIRVRELR